MLSRPVRRLARYGAEAAAARHRALLERRTLLEEACGDLFVPPPPPPSTGSSEVPSDAAAADAASASGPLAGVALCVDDVADVEGWPTALGLGAHDVFNFAHVVRRTDADVVDTLRRAGCLVAGKTRVLPFHGSGNPPEARFGHAALRSPWNAAHGLSSGAAGAVAAGLCDVGLSTQGRGEVVVSAGKAGVCGYKATRGGLSLAGVCTHSGAESVGVFGRTVDDVLAVAEVLAAESDEDVGAEVELHDEEGGRLRVGALRQWGKYSSAAEWEVEAPVRVLQGMPEAFQVVDVEHRVLMDLTTPAALHDGFCALNMVANHESFMGNADPTPARFSKYRRFPRCHSSRDYLSSRGLHEVSLPHQIERYGTFVDYLFKKGRVDVLAAPVAPSASTSPSGAVGNQEFALPFTVSGHPAVCVPLGRLSPEGVPLALQLVGRRNADLQLLHIAQIVSEAVVPRVRDDALVPLYDREAGHVAEQCPAPL
eukprot:Rhum_TRINITY_DN15440_c7_g1::Rhum_TRINITY_DN15440_c7_g1_i3::g.157158::m.157158